MNNPFGIPDELMEVIIQTAAKQAVNGSRPTGFTQSDPIHVKTVEYGAKAAKELFDSYVKVGFTETQAFDLLKCVLTKNNR
jgi:hypothetical protein